MEFRLYRTAFHASIHEETEQYHVRYQSEISTDRLRTAAYLNSVAFNYDLDNPPRLNRTAFSARKHADSES